MSASAFIVFLTALICQSASAGVTKMENVPIVYPGPVSVMADEPGTEVKDPCEHLTYCTHKPDDYPQDKVNEILKGYKHLPQPVMLDEDKLNNKYGEDNSENCLTARTFEPVYKVREKREDPWRMVIQSPEKDYLQRVSLEKCQKPDAKCFEGLCTAPGVKAVCKQKFSHWQILVAKGNNETEMIKAELPISCSCQVEEA